MGAFDDLIPPKSKPADGGIKPRLFDAFQETLAPAPAPAPAATGAFDDLVPAEAAPAPPRGTLGRIGDILGRLGERFTLGTVTPISGTQEQIGDIISEFSPLAALRAVTENVDFGADTAAVRQAYADPVGARELARQGAAITREAAEDRAAVQARTAARPASIGEALADPLAAADYYGGILAESAPQTLAAIATRNPEIAAGVLGALSAGQTYGGARADGQGVVPALGEALAGGAMETVLGRVPLSEAFTPGLRRFVTAPLAEAGTEAATEIGQSAVGQLARGQDVDIAAALPQAIDAAIVGAVTGMGEAALGGGQAPAEAAPRTALDDSAFADLIPAEPPIARRPDAPAAPAAEPVPAAAEAAPPAPAVAEPVAPVAPEPAAVPPVEEGPVRAPEPITPTEGRLEVDADTGRGQFRLVDEPAPPGADYSEFGQVRIIEAFDGDTKVGELLYANDGTPPTVNVEPEYQRRGIATAMYELARQQGGILGDAQGGIRGRAEQYRTPAGMAFRTGADASRITLAPARPAAVESAGAPPPAATPQAEPAPASPPVTPPAAVRAEPVSPAPAPEGVIASDERPYPELAESASRPSVTQPPAGTGGGAPAPTGTKNRITDAERAAESREPILRAMRQSNEETVTRAREAMADNPRLVDEIVARAGDAPISVTEEAAMLIGKVEARNRREDAAKVLADPKASPEQKAVAQAAWDAAEAEINRIDEANVARGREWGRLGQFRQRLMAADFTLEAMESKLRRAKGGPLTAEETAGLKALSEKLQAAETDLEAARAKIAEYEQTVIVRETIEQAVRAATAQMRSASRAGKSKLEVLKERADAARKRLREAESVPSKRGQSGAVTNPVAMLADVIDIGAYHVANGAVKLADWVKAMTADLGDRFTALQDRWPDLFAAARRANVPAKPDAPTTAEVLATIDSANLTREDVRDLVMARIRAGEREADAVMRAVTSDVQTIVPEATEADVRQLFADYGKRASPTRDADKQTLRDLRTVVRLEKDIADAEAGLPRKTPVARQRASEEIRQLRARLSELLKQAGRRARTPEAEAVLLAKRREVLEKQIADLGDQVETGRRPPAGTPRLTPEQLKDLTDQRDRLRNRVRWLDREAKKAAEAPAKAAAAAKQRENDRLNLIDGLNAQAERIQAQIDGGYREIPKSTQKVMDAGVAEARRKLAEVKEARREVDRQTFADDIAAAKAEKRRADLSEQIADLEDMLRTGRRPDKRDRTESNPDLAARRDELQREIRRIDAAMRPRRSPDEVYQQRRGTSIAREIERVQARIAAGDYARSPRVPKALNEANQEAFYRLEKLRQDFRSRQFFAELQQRSRAKRYLDNTASGLNLARAVMTSFDLSALLRQGGFVALGHPVRAAESIPDMLKAFSSERAALKVENDIKDRDNAPLYKRAGLQITDDSGSLSKMEEAYMTRFLNKLERKPGQPARNFARTVFNVATAPVRGSARAYSTFLNKLRADSFDAMLASLQRGAEPTDAEIKAIANYINVATGRGKVPLMSESAAAGLNTIFFAPKLVASRFQLLAGQPLYGGSNRTRAMIAQDYARYLTGVAVVYALGAMLNATLDEDEDDRRPFIELDPRSSSFGRMRFGDWFVDPLSGLAQVSTIIARTTAGETKTGAGEVRPQRPVRRLTNLLYETGQLLDRAGFEALAGEFPEKPNYEKLGMKDSTTLEAIGSFIRTKLAPVPGAGINWLAGTGFDGQITTTAGEAGGLVTPMTFGNIADAMRDNGVPGGTALTMAEILGMGVMFRDRSSFDAPDYADLDFDQKRDYSAYLQRTQNMKQDLQALRDLANSFPEDASPSDVRDAVQMKAEQLGIDGIDLGQYSRRTTARDDRGIRKSGLKRTESGNVQLEYDKGSITKMMLDTEKSVNKINREMEDFIRQPMSDEMIDKKYREYVSGGEANGDKSLVIRQMRDQREQAIRLFMEASGEN